MELWFFPISRVLACCLLLATCLRNLLGPPYDTKEGYKTKIGSTGSVTITLALTLALALTLGSG